MTDNPASRWNPADYIANAGHCREMLAGALETLPTATTMGITPDGAPAGTVTLIWVTPT